MTGMAITIAIAIAIAIAIGIAIAIAIAIANAKAILSLPMIKHTCLLRHAGLEPLGARLACAL